MKTPSNSVRDCRKYYTGELKKIYDIKEADILIMMLLDHYFGIDRIKIAMEPELRLSESELLTLHFAVKDLLKNKPVQYIIGETEFCGMRFFVDENVLIPRPETQEMVEMISDREKACSILDIGTGSGCIAISLAKLLTNSDVTAIDISEKALDVARKNAAANDVTVDFIHANIFNLQDNIFGKDFDIIVSNPPYVCDSEKSEMHANVLEHEPATALFVPDNDPLVFYRKILDFARKALKPDGEIWFEINERFGNEMRQLCIEKVFNNTLIINDFREKERIVKAQRRFL